MEEQEKDESDHATASTGTIRRNPTHTVKEKGGRTVPFHVTIGSSQATL